jgi:hypothetical protein
VYIGYNKLYRVYPEFMDKLHERVLHTKTKKKVNINICPQENLDLQPNNVLLTSIL